MQANLHLIAIFCFDIYSKLVYSLFMKRTMTKEIVIELLGGVPNTAKFFGIEPQAIYQWPNFELIPELREAQLRLKRPELFEVA